MNDTSAWDGLKEERARTQELLGNILMRWGNVMEMVYGLPESLGFSSPDAIQLGLAMFNGDGMRIEYLIQLLRA